MVKRMNITLNSLIIISLAALSACVPINQPAATSTSGGKAKTLQLIDRAYESVIKTIQLHPDAQPLDPAVTRLGQWNLVLEFDDLRDHNDNYYARIIHCNYNWTQSNLSDLDFMTGYNEFPINTFAFSVDTHVPFVHYKFNVPGVKLPGNYVLVVYRESNKDDIILSRRFMVYQNQVTFKRDGNLIGPGNAADISQQLNFTINYQNVNIMNAMTDVHVNMRQNQRWDNIVSDVRPSFVREIEKEIEYRYFDDAKMFRGGNEFRFFDLRSLNYPGQNVDRINKTTKPFEAYIQKDKSRENEAYSQPQIPDINGNFNLDNYDYRDMAYANYVNVNFTLAVPPVANGDVYVAGAFNYWNLGVANKMKYDSVQNAYTARMLLKQGWYNYQYVVRAPKRPSYMFEGSHFETENFYEVFVYYRPYQPQADLLIGYERIDANPRR